MTHSLAGIAQKLIETLGGDLNETTIQGTIDVFEGIIQGVHSNWEQHLTKGTNDALSIDNIKCTECGAKIRVTRDRSIITVDTI